MLHIYQTNLTETLLSQLSAEIAQRPAAMPVLMAEQILVQNPDMAQWLKIELAERHGIAANLSFPMPSAFVWQLFRELFDDLPERTPYGKEQMIWHLMQLLPGCYADPDFAWVERYVQSAQGQAPDELAQEQQFRLYQLCASIADVFDQYLIYRPQWMAAWEQGESAIALPPDQRWQPKLWQQLAEAIAQRLAATGTAAQGVDRGHRATLLSETIQMLESQPEGSVRFKSLPPRIFLFGISSLPQQSMALLNALARHIDLHWFQVNPCEHYWLDIVDSKALAKLSARHANLHLDDLTQARYFLVGNPLLAALGGLGREHLSLMYELLDGDLHEVYQPFPAGGALGLLQNEIQQLSCRGQFEPLSAAQLDSNDGKLALAEADLHNLRLHQCYSPMREVEVLKDQLLALFAADPQLQPNDIMVMMPDVATYAPFIHAVFSAPIESTDGTQQRLPYSINDLSATQESPLIASLFTLLDLPDSRLNVSEVLSVLEVPAVMARFDIDEDALELIKHWLDEVGVRWGENSEHRQRLGIGAFEQNSWQFGLRRMLAGYALHPQQGLYGDSLPYIEIEGSQAEALGKLLMFVDQLSALRRELTAPCSAAVWQQRLNSLINQFYAGDLNETQMLQRAAAALESLHEYCQQSGFSAASDAMLSRLIVKDYLQQALSVSIGGRRFRAGAINFCTLMPMRSIPFKVIALLGMSDGEFPRRNEPVSFDLMAARRERGDRSRRLDDRYLFLEALLSSRAHLHISWVGRDIRTDNPLPPSILVTELLDYIAEAWILAGDEALEPQDAARRLLDALTIQHPLQPFNPDYFQSGRLPRSYASLWAAALNHAGLAAEAFVQQPLPLPDELAEAIAADAGFTLELGQLESLLVNPCQAFMQRRLGVYFDPLEGEGEDTEPFALDALASWQVKQHAVEQLLGDGQLSRYYQQHRYSGALPFGEAGEQLLSGALDAAQGIREHWAPMLAVGQPPQELRAVVPLSYQQHTVRVVVAAALPVAVEGVRLQIKPGRISGKDQLRGWLRHLLCCAAGEGACWIIVDSENSLCWRPLEPTQAQAYLAALIHAYLDGLGYPLPLFIKTGLSYLDAVDAGKSEAQILDLLQRQWLPGVFNRTGEGGDPYIARCYPQLEAVYAPLGQWSEQLLRPMLEHQHRQKPTPRARTEKPLLPHAVMLETLEQWRRQG